LPLIQAGMYRWKKFVRRYGVCMKTNEKALPDTNTILRYLLDDEPALSKRASLFWEEVKEGKIQTILTEGVLMECVYVLQRFYKVPRTTIAEKLTGLLSYKGLVEENKELFGYSLDVYSRTVFDFVDCLLYSAERAGMGTVFSFDEKLNKHRKK
jgi:predicted nucleic-acid-binding protein